MGKTSVKETDERKTTLRYSAAVGRLMDELKVSLGLNRNVAMVVGIGMLGAQFAPLLTARGVKRRELLEEIQAEVNQLFEDAKALC